MNWDDVRIFLAVARAGQLLSAARRLGLNHATLSRRLTALETALQARLVIRRTTGCELTAEGVAFLQSAERMEAEFIAARAAASGAADISGTVRIGAPDGFGIGWLAPRLAPLIERHPDLTIQLVPAPRAFSLSRREADIAITVERPQSGRLAARKLTDYALRLYASPGYLERHGAPVAPADLARHQLVGYVDDLIFSPSLNYTGEIAPDWAARLEISSALGQAEAVAAGAGIGILHAFVAAGRTDLQRVLPDSEIRRAYWLVVHENERSLPRIRLVADFIAQAVAAEREVFG